MIHEISSLADSSASIYSDSGVTTDCISLTRCDSGQNMSSVLATVVVHAGCIVVRHWVLLNRVHVGSSNFELPDRCA